MFRVQLDNQPAKFLKNSDRILMKRLAKKIDSPKQEPMPHDAKRIANRKETTFRVRVGEYRILYIVYHDDNCIFISKIDKRSKVYG